MKTPWRDGTTHVVMSDGELVEKLVALVPAPRFHLIRYRGRLDINVQNLQTRSVPECQGHPIDHSTRQGRHGHCWPVVVHRRQVEVKLSQELETAIRTSVHWRLPQRFVKAM